MNKREAVLSVIDQNQQPAYTPAGFFLHFDPQYHRGQAGVEKHLEFFRATGMDFVKVQYEHHFPQQDRLRRPEDWAHIPQYGVDFFEEPLGVVAGLVKAAKPEALVIVTLYSPFMIAGQVAGGGLVDQHIKENPQQVKRGMEIITASLMQFVKGCIDLGVDGFYTSTQGGEAGRFDDPALFDECVRPYDLALMEEINRRTIFNILHICDYHLPYAGISRYVDYPGHVVNASLDLAGGQHISAREVASMFNRPFMGGMNRKGIIATGSTAEVERAARAVLEDAPERFILGADCTVPSTTPWENLRTAIHTAHTFA